MKTSKKTAKSPAKTQVKIHDLKPAKTVKGGSGGWNRSKNIN